MANPLDTHLRTHAPVGMDMRDWCHEQNIRPIFEKMNRWYFVANDNGRDTVSVLDGTDGGNVRRLLAGELDDFEGWPQSRMDGYRTWLRGIAVNGLRPNALAS